MLIHAAFVQLFILKLLPLTITNVHASFLDRHETALDAMSQLMNDSYQDETKTNAIDH